MRRHQNTARRILSMTIALLWILCCQATAEINGGTVQQGEEFEIPVYVSANPNQAVFALLKLEYDHNVFELIPGFVQKDTASIMNLSGIPEGEAGKAKLRVLKDAKKGTYRISISIESADNIDENPVTGLEMETVSISIGKKREENKYYPNGKLKTEYEYDSRGYLLKISHYNRYGYVTWTEESTEWDASGNVLKDETRYPNSTDKYAVYYYTYTYDSRGNRTSSSYVYGDGSPAETYSTMQYDENNHRTRLTYYNADGSIERYNTDYRYDDNDHVIGFTTFDGNNNITSRNTDYLYDSDGNLLNYTVQDAAGNLKEYHRQTWENGIRTESITTNSAGKIIDQAQYDSYGDTVYSYYTYDSGETSTSNYKYNEDNYTIKNVTKKANGTFSYGYFDVYNVKGQVIQSEWLDESGNATNVDEYEYDSKGNRVKWKYTYGSYSNWYTYEYNEKGQIIREYSLDETGNVKSFTDYEYNAQGKESKKICRNADGSFGYGYTYEYNSEGQKIRENYIEENGKIKSYEVYEYNSHGDKTRNTSYNAEGQRTSYTVYEYDSQYRRTSYISYRKDGTKSYERKTRYLEDGTSQDKTISYNLDGTLREESDWE